MPLTLRRLVIGSIIGTGISSVTTQLLVIREFLSQFHGNEITICLVISCWLLLSGLGSLAARAVKRGSVTAYGLMALLTAMGPLLQLAGIRYFREQIFTHGVSPGFYPILFFVLFCTAPYAVLIGFVLPYAQKVLADHDRPIGSGDLYLTDSIGDVIGGALFSFVLVYRFTPFATVGLASIFSALAGLGILLNLGRRLLVALGIPILTAFLVSAFDSDMEQRTLGGQYGEIVRYLESPYGRIIVSKEDSQYTFWESGTPIHPAASLVSSEERVHYPLSQLDRPGVILLISGGLGETLREVAKHRPERIDYLELDPRLTEASIRLGVLEENPVLRIIHGDARRHIRGKKRVYDAILMNLSDPDTFQVNRFFTREFFALARQALKEGGVLCLAMEYSANYLGEVRRRKLSSLQNTAREHFRNVLVLPGEEAYFLCSDGELDPDIPARLRSKGVTTTYIEGSFYGDVTPDRIRMMAEALDREEPPNSDFSPRLMNLVFREWFSKHGSSPVPFALVLIGLCLGYFVFMKREEYVLFSTGLVAMGAEMIVVFSFQVMHGYIYLEIGAIVTAFLLGLLPGAFVANRYVGRNLRHLLGSDVLLILLLSLFYGWVRYSSRELPPEGFLAYGFLFSFLCGFQFPVASKIIGEERSPAAALLSADLTGAAVGSLAVGALFIPLWGMDSALIFLIVVKISSTLVSGVLGVGKA